MPEDNRVLYRGVVFESKTALSRHYQISVDKLYRYLKDGLSIEEAVDKCNERKMIYRKNGKEYVYESARALCRAWGIDYTRFTRAMRSGKTVDEAVALCVKTMQKKERGNGSVRERFGKNGMSYDKYYRLKKQGCSEEEALMNASKTDLSLIYKDVKYSNMTEMSRTLNLNYVTFRRLLSKGVSIDEAVESSKTENIKPFAQAIRIDGVEYPSMRAYCKAHGIGLSTFQKNVKKGLIKLEKF